MNATYQHTLAGLFALTAILALLALAGNGSTHVDALRALPDARGEPVSATEHAADAAQHRAQRRAVRAQLSMPYFSYSRALPRTAEI